MSDDGFLLDAWLSRINCCGSRDPTLETLRGLVFAHAHAIAYESLDVSSSVGCRTCASPRFNSR